MKTILITRPKKDTQALIEALAEQGFESLSEPIFSISALPENKPLLTAALKRHPQAILATSRHAISIFTRLSRQRSIPVMAVGTATAAHAKKLGFQVAATAEGSAQSLAALVKKRCKPAQGPLLYICGTEISFDIAHALARHHFLMDTVELYHATPAKRFSPALRKALTKQTIDGVLFFSERTAATYVKLALKHNLKDEHCTLSAFVLSKKIAQALRGLPWQHIHVATRPDTESLLDKLNSLRH